MVSDKDLVRSLLSCDELEIACGRCVFGKEKDFERTCRDKLMQEAAKRIKVLAALDADLTADVRGSKD